MEKKVFLTFLGVMRSLYGDGTCKSGKKKNCGRFIEFHLKNDCIAVSIRSFLKKPFSFILPLNEHP